MTGGMELRMRTSVGGVAVLLQPAGETVCKRDTKPEGMNKWLNNSVFPTFIKMHFPLTHKACSSRLSSPYTGPNKRNNINWPKPLATPSIKRMFIKQNKNKLFEKKTCSSKYVAKTDTQCVHSKFSETVNPLFPLSFISACAHTHKTLLSGSSGACSSIFHLTFTDTDTERIHTLWNKP